MLTVIEAIHATELAAEFMRKMSLNPDTQKPRSPEQVALIVDLINTAVEAMQDGEEEEPQIKITNVSAMSAEERSELVKNCRDDLKRIFGGLK